MTARARRIDLVADEFLAAVSGEMSPAELGVYWLINLLCYSRNGMIDHNLDWLRAKFRPGKANQVIAPIIEKLIASGRVVRDGDQIGVRRALDEVEKALRRISEAAESGGRGGRPRKENNTLEKGSPFPAEKLTTNHQPPTTKEKRDKPDLRSDFAAWYAAYPRKVAPGRAEKAYAKARNLTSADELLDGIERYRRGKASYADWRHPATWLNDKGWLDDYGDAEPSGDDGPKGPPPTPEDLWPDLKTMGTDDQAIRITH